MPSCEPICPETHKTVDGITKELKKTTTTTDALHGSCSLGGFLVAFLPPFLLSFSWRDAQSTTKQRQEQHPNNRNKRIHHDHDQAGPFHPPSGLRPPGRIGLCSDGLCYPHSIPPHDHFERPGHQRCFLSCRRLQGRNMLVRGDPRDSGWYVHERQRTKTTTRHGTERRLNLLWMCFPIHTYTHVCTCSVFLQSY